jgi:hypothetical protein
MINNLSRGLAIAWDKVRPLRRQLTNFRVPIISALKWCYCRWVGDGWNGCINRYKHYLNDDDVRRCN